MELNVIGMVLVLVLLAVATGVLLYVDGRSVQRAMKAFMALLLQMVVVGAGAWAVYRYDSVWIGLLWLVVMLALASLWCMMKSGLKRRNMLVPMAGAVMGSSVVMGGATLLCVGGRMLVPVTGVLLGYLLTSVVQMAQTYDSSLRHTEEHRRYLIANGATLLESVMPSVRRALRASVQAQLKQMASPLVVAMPLLFCGMLMGGAQPLLSLAVTLLLMAAAFAASVFSAVLFLVLAERFSSLSK